MSELREEGNEGVIEGCKRLTVTREQNKHWKEQKEMYTTHTISPGLSHRKGRRERGYRYDMKGHDGFVIHNLRFGTVTIDTSLLPISSSIRRCLVSSSISSSSSSVSTERGPWVVEMSSWPVAR